MEDFTTTYLTVLQWRLFLTQFPLYPKVDFGILYTQTRIVLQCTRRIPAIPDTMTPYTPSRTTTLARNQRLATRALTL